MELLTNTLTAISDVDRQAGEQAKKRLDSLTKPPGSLGVLEDIAVQLAAIQGKAIPGLGPKVVMVMAADHGVVEEGVSAFPQEVTRQMVINFLHHGAAINVLANQADTRVVVTDVGIKGDPVEHPELNNRKISPGTRNMVQEAAMTEAEVIAAVEVGIEMVNLEIDRGATIVAIGEMGIGNTTSSAAILACLTGKDLELITGRGTGIDDEGLIRKRAAIRKAIEVNSPVAADPLDVLRKVGGLEIAALTGVILGAVSRKVPVVLDGFISSTAALVAHKLHHHCQYHMIASHLSQEPGHKIVLGEMGLKAILQLDLRLGEGTGAVLAFNLIEAAVKIITEMATFEEAGVSNKD